MLAGLSDITVSRVERGQVESLSVGSLRRVARVLEARLDFGLWTRGGDVERLASARHSELVEQIVATLVRLGWVVRPEVSFNVRGERGLVDIVAWHAATRALLLIEVKTEIVDVGELFGTFDRKRRLGSEIARLLGYEPVAVSTALVVADTHTNHRRIRAHAATFGAALPDGGHRFRAYLRAPSGSLQALAYWPYQHPGTTSRRSSSSRRVRRPGACSVRALRSAGKLGSGARRGRPGAGEPEADR